ncbi:unnamed protein product [Adineta steineri]|uniref:3-oxoacyl-[acyl-carrier-protein] reductase n=2 Tax=Adineta steineri TaxID=433720 RepID=A0A813ZJE2_9BILA|nr:unnamed protein product [Adineta steineri]CAF3744328.1 unnamed protein product [Adineta steineri]
MTSSYRADLVNKYSKYIKTIHNRVVEVEFYWFQTNPCQSYRLRINEKQFLEAQKHIRSKKLINMKFEPFVDLIAPVFANDAAEISISVLRLTFDRLFDQNSNGTVEQQEFEALLILLQGFNTHKQSLFNENLRQIFPSRTNHVSFKGLTTFILSSLNDFGLNIVHKFAKQGCNIILNGKQNDENIIQTIQNTYGKNQIMYLSEQIQNEINIYKLVEQILNSFQHIDILIINHECRQHYRASIEEFPIEKWKEIIDCNLTRNFTLVKTLWPHMKRQHFGRIIHIANEHSQIASEYQSACITSHHALLGLNKALSIEGASYGITSNIICPSYTQANFSEQYNHIKTIADLVLFLCTDQARTITDQSIPWSNSI